ncbi:DDE-type integrase/transposase/recombinase [Helcococcus ovis]|uniref:DDE-type integrase/transposase/recombinase n=2 Tax=Helcococcus ovis TaxID=72026 RepID=UPI001ADD18D1|nr:DDE-type integrase/transposase/recombinase [Helcococcus ovis]
MFVINVFYQPKQASNFRHDAGTDSPFSNITLQLKPFLTRSFELIQGVPKTILSDNMKTIMDEPRTKDSDGKINNKFNQFLNDFNISLKPCMARRPQTKGKLENKLEQRIKHYTGYRLLIIDEMGYLPLNDGRCGLRTAPTFFADFIYKYSLILYNKSVNVGGDV